MTPRRNSDPDRSERWKWLPKAELLELLNLRPGMRVAEIGAGRDVIPEIAERIGPEGRAFAAESPREADRFPADSCDRVLIVNRWAELVHPVDALHAAKRLLRDDGRLIVVEWHPDAQCPGAPEARVALQELVRLLEHNAWDLHRHGDLGPHCYFLDAGVSDESVQS